MIVSIQLIHSGSARDLARPESRDVGTTRSGSRHIMENPVSLVGNPEALHAVFDDSKGPSSKSMMAEPQIDSPDAATQAALRQKDNSDALFEAEPYSLEWNRVHSADTGLHRLESKSGNASSRCRVDRKTLMHYKQPNQKSLYMIEADMWINGTDV